MHGSIEIHSSSFRTLVHIDRFGANLPNSRKTGAVTTDSIRAWTVYLDLRGTCRFYGQSMRAMLTDLRPPKNITNQAPLQRD